MHPRCAELVDLLTAERDQLMEAVAQVPADRRDDRPAEGAWTVGEVLDHLLIIEAGSARLLAKQLARAREAGLGPETQQGSVMDGLGAVDVVNGPPRQAPEMVLPRPGVRAEDALAGLRASRVALLDVLRDGDGLALGQVKARHAALGDLDLYGWGLFIAQHERRHARQVRGIARALAGGAEVAD